MSDINWTVTAPSREVKRVASNKLEHLDALEIKEGIAKGQKKFAEQYNAMRQTLIDNGLMKEK